LAQLYGDFIVVVPWQRTGGLSCSTFAGHRRTLVRIAAPSSTSAGHRWTCACQRHQLQPRCANLLQPPSKPRFVTSTPSRSSTTSPPCVDAALGSPPHSGELQIILIVIVGGIQDRYTLRSSYMDRNTCKKDYTHMRNRANDFRFKFVGPWQRTGIQLY
jgi:hypothetical protein